MARPQHIPGDGTAYPLNAPSNVLGPVLTHGEWLATLKTGSVVLVRNGRLHFRLHGWQVKRGAAYRMHFRLVRNEQELT